MLPIKISIVGFGHQSQKYVKSIKKSSLLAIDSIVDQNTALFSTSPLCTDIATFSAVEDMLSQRKPDVALVCLPHAAHRRVVEVLARAGVSVIKEKPYALTEEEAAFYAALQQETGTQIVTPVKRRFDPVYRAFPEKFKSQLGEIVCFDATFAKNIADLGDGWRASQQIAGGGALIDMGYHFVDLLTWYFGAPQNMVASLSTHNRPGQVYDVEDTANLMVSYPCSHETQREFTGHLCVTRVYPHDKEEMTITGRHGCVVISDQEAVLYNGAGTLLDRVVADKTLDVNQVMLETVAHQLATKSPIPETGAVQTAFICEAYRQYKAQEKRKQKNAKSDFVWPPISDETEKIVVQQLHTDISIYNRSGIFKTFEDRFAAYHQRKHALLSNSGTTAIYSMFEALNLMPGDEVICPAYTFFATVSPIVHTGAKPVFADCGPDGNIDPASIKAKITPQTKAVIVTHMWGIPCEMDAIQDICRQHHIALLEDCSHAHGAMYKGQKCGSFGDMAAWSLQGQKIVTGGEGGIMLTNHDDYYYRAVLQGHYNKRCKQDIPADHPLQKFALTGLGLKFRAHPLAIAMADQQFSHLDDWIAQKNIYARELTDMLAAFDCIIPPNHDDRVPSWYAYVFQVREGNAYGLTAKKLFDALQAEGLKEADLPTSTGPIYNLPLFTATHTIMPRLYKEPCVTTTETFTAVECFYKQAVKLPVWAFEAERPLFERYKQTLCRVLCTLTQNAEGQTTQHAVGE